MAIQVTNPGVRPIAFTSALRTMPARIEKSTASIASITRNSLNKTGLLKRFIATSFNLCCLKAELEMCQQPRCRHAYGWAHHNDLRKELTLIKNTHATESH